MEVETGSWRSRTASLSLPSRESAGVGPARARPAPTIRWADGGGGVGGILCGSCNQVAQSCA